MSRSQSAPLSQRLLRLALAGLLPVFLLAAVALVLLVRQQDAEMRRAMTQTTRASISAVDSELLRSIAILQALATAQSLEQNDFERFYRSLRRALEDHPSWATIILTDTRGAQHLIAITPLARTESAPAGDPESVRLALRERRPVVGPVRRDPLLNAHVYTIHAPVIHDGNVRYVLSAIVYPESLLAIVRQQRIPDGAVVTVFDQHRNVVARSSGQARHVGRPIAPGFADFIGDQRDGWGITPTPDGESVHTAFSISGFSEWGVGLDLPSEVIETPIWRSSAFLALGVLISLALGAVGAILMARRITQPIAKLREAALAVGRGEVPSMIDSEIAEIQDVAGALAQAAQARNRMESIREETLRLEREARALAEDSNRMKDQFLAMFGHELRNPLAAIKSALHLLTMPAADEGRKRHARTILRRQVDHLTHLVNDLLDVERVVTGRVVLETGPLDFADALNDALGALRGTGMLDRHDFAATTESIWVNADRTRLEQVITNLLVNATKYTPPGRRIRVALAAEEGEAVLRVSDEGIGIDAHMLAKIFDLFVQGESGLDRQQAGFGVGLTLVRKLTELHGGRVTAQSEGAGKGSVFTVRLPAIEPPRLERRADAPITQTRAARRLLIIEDNDDARSSLRDALTLLGHAVEEAADGTSGVAAALRLRPEVALIDLGLPQINGYEVARRIRAALGRSIRLIALTGYSLEEDRRRSYEAGFDAHLVKPVALDELDAVLVPPEPEYQRA